jgi:hypothetical protein
LYAKQVATNCSYDESVDVYSLALVLWEVASLERPYKGYNKAKFFDRVVRLTKCFARATCKYFLIWGRLGRRGTPSAQPWRLCLLGFV